MRFRLRAPSTVALAVAAGAFVLYWSTLLPGLDFGDTASFQVMGGSPVISPRDAYPLYFAIGRAFTWIVPGRPALALNFASATEAAVASGMFVLAAFELSGALFASAIGAALFATSYTFWSQSIIAEVYALHIAFVLATLLALLRWQQQPSLGRLIAFFALYAAAFGNHLSMVLLLPAYAAFLLIAAPDGWRTVVTPRVVALAVLIAAAGALQYAWNLHSLWRMPQLPASIADALGRFWFDVTKSDWRETMVLQVPAGMTSERVRMYAFEVEQQFGWLLACAGVVGIVTLLRRDWRRAALLLIAYGANVAFALSYNVGDSHVFFLPSHLLLALMIAIGLAALDRMAGGRRLVAAVALALVGWRAYDNWPALDRHRDERPLRVLDALASGATDRDAILLTDLNWQVENGLNYFAKYSRPEVAFARMPDVLLYAPALARDNRAIGRRLLLSERAQVELASLYRPLFDIVPDAAVPVPTLLDIVRSLPAGTRYVLCVLKPTREMAFDQTDLVQSLDGLTAGSVRSVPASDYAAVVGTVGDRPVLVRESDRPFRADVRAAGVGVEVRMESWLAFDTIRRMGFGQVVAGRHHTLIVERGISFAAFDAGGSATTTAYFANIFAAQPRYVATLH